MEEEKKGGRRGAYQVAGESKWLPTARYSAGRMGWVASTVTALQRQVAEGMERGREGGGCEKREWRRR